MLRPNWPGKAEEEYRKEEKRSIAKKRAKKSGKNSGFYGKFQSQRRAIMTGSEDQCACVRPTVGEGENQPSLCPTCGKRIPAPKQFSDSMLEATYEILAEEGAIWSGAR
jgi:hypothetical protein